MKNLRLCRRHGKHAFKTVLKHSRRDSGYNSEKSFGRIVPKQSLLEYLAGKYFHRFSHEGTYMAAITTFGSSCDLKGPRSQLKLITDLGVPSMGCWFWRHIKAKVMGIKGLVKVPENH